MIKISCETLVMTDFPCRGMYSHIETRRPLCPFRAQKPELSAMSRHKGCWVTASQAVRNPFPTMHHCLHITEILINIFDLYDEQSKHTLLQLALVCKLFHEPALDALWRFQSSFLVLVKTFPRDLWEETGEPATLVRYPLNSGVDRISEDIRLVI